MKHNIIHFYASNNFDKNELDAIREAKKKAISEKYISSYIEEIGTGSSNKTTVFCIPIRDSRRHACPKNYIVCYDCLP